MQDLIRKLLAELGEDPDLDGKKAVLAERAAEMQSRLDEQSDEDDSDDDTEEL